MRVALETRDEDNPDAHLKWRTKRHRKRGKRRRKKNTRTQKKEGEKSFKTDFSIEFLHVFMMRTSFSRCFSLWPNTRRSNKNIEKNRVTRDTKCTKHMKKIEKNKSSAGSYSTSQYSTFNLMTTVNTNRLYTMHVWAPTRKTNKSACFAAARAR